MANSEKEQKAAERAERREKANSALGLVKQTLRNQHRAGLPGSLTREELILLVAAIDKLDNYSFEEEEADRQAELAESFNSAPIQMEKIQNTPGGAVRVSGRVVSPREAGEVAGAAEAAREAAEKKANPEKETQEKAASAKASDEKSSASKQSVSAASVELQKPEVRHQLNLDRTGSENYPNFPGGSSAKGSDAEKAAAQTKGLSDAPSGSPKANAKESKEAQEVIAKANADGRKPATKK